MFLIENNFNNPEYIEKIQDYIAELRCSEKNKLNKSKRTKIEEDISENIKTCFNFQDATFNIIEDDEENAYTYTTTKHDYPIIVTSDGFKFDDKNKNNLPGIDIFITTGLFFNSKFSDREIMAIILHEIGHHFDQSINRLYNININKEKSTTILDIINLRKNIEKNKNKKDAIKFCNIVLSAAEKANPEIIAALVNCAKQISEKFSNTVSNINPISNYVDFTLTKTSDAEDFADEFAAAYGYRADLISSLQKLDSPTNNPVMEINSKLEYINNVVIGFILFGPELASMIFFSDMQTRIAKLTENLNSELKNSNLNSKQKSLYQKQLKNINKEIEKSKSLYKEKIKEDPKNTGVYVFKIFVLSNIGRAVLGNKTYTAINYLDNYYNNKK